MKLATVRYEGHHHTAVVGDDGTCSLMDEALGTVDDIVRGGPATLGEVQRELRTARRAGVTAVTFAAPLRRFNRDILCTGWNYWRHFDESRGHRHGNEPETRPTHPAFFTKGPDTVIGPHDDIAYDPDLSSEWDYEAEIAVVIGRDGRSIPEERAFDHVFGFMVVNDVSQRDLQQAHGGQWLKGKSIDHTMPTGPWVTTADEIDDLGSVIVQCELNGTLMQDTPVRQMAFPIETLIAELSSGMTLRAGSVLLTGTPSGVGNARDPQVFLTEGDVVVTRASGLGELRNRVTRTKLT